MIHLERLRRSCHAKEEVEVMLVFDNQKFMNELEKEGADKHKLLGGPGHRSVKFKYSTECNAPRLITQNKVELML